MGNQFCHCGRKVEFECWCCRARVCGGHGRLPSFQEVLRDYPVYPDTELFTFAVAQFYELYGFDPGEIAAVCDRCRKPIEAELVRRVGTKFAVDLENRRSEGRVCQYELSPQKLCDNEAAYRCSVCSKLLCRQHAVACDFCKTIFCGSLDESDWPYKIATLCGGKHKHFWRSYSLRTARDVIR